MAMKRCPGYTSTGDAGLQYSQAPHMVENDTANFSPGKSQCRDCYGMYAKDWRARRGAGVTVPRQRRTGGSRPVIQLPDFRAPALDGGENAEFVSDEDLASGSHAFVPQADVLETWGAVTNAAAGGAHPFNLIFLGPSGSGKTECAEFLAGAVGLPFTKVDAPSMTDPESWFGTREVVADEESGASVTTYRPSAFVLAIEQPGVLLIDEINRIRDEHRNILLPLMDGTHQVTNPLTGDVVRKHNKCFIIGTGNRGLQFTGTYAVDPALLTRALIVEFDYAAPDDETRIAKEATGCEDEVAETFVRFATESRTKAVLDPDFSPISTREVINACRLVRYGAQMDTAARMVVLNGASPEGGAGSVRAQLEMIWTGIRRAAAGQAPAKRPCGAQDPWGMGSTCEIEVDVAAGTHPGQEHAADGREWS